MKQKDILKYWLIFNMIIILGTNVANKRTTRNLEGQVDQLHVKNALLVDRLKTAEEIIEEYENAANYEASLKRHCSMSAVECLP